MGSEIKKSLFKNLNKIFQARGQSEENILKKEELEGFMDPANVCMIIPKTKELKDFILVNFDAPINKIPELDYKPSDTSKEVTSKYSGEYLRHILEIVKHNNEVFISMKPDYPLKIETEDLIYILAPRLGYD